MTAATASCWTMGTPVSVRNSFPILCYVNGFVTLSCLRTKSCMRLFTKPMTGGGVQYAAQPLFPAPTGRNIARIAGSDKDANRPQNVCANCAPMWTFRGLKSPCIMRLCRHRIGGVKGFILFPQNRRSNA